MPLSPLPPSNTKRYKLLYTVAGQQHSMISRCSSAQSDGVAVGFFNAQFAAITGALGPNVVWVGVEVALSGSDIFNPIAGWSPLTGTAGNDVSTINEPRAFCYSGRTVGGRKSKVFLYGVGDDVPTPATYEMDPLPGSGEFNNFWVNLNGQADFWLGIDGLKPIWYFRNTVKPNDHFIGLLR